MQSVAAPEHVPQPVPQTKPLAQAAGVATDGVPEWPAAQKVQ